MRKVQSHSTPVMSPVGRHLMRGDARDESLRSFRRWVSVAGVLTLATSFSLAVPGLIADYYGLLSGLNRALGLGGSHQIAPRGGENQLSVNAAGILFCVFGLLLVYASMDLRQRMGIVLLNAVERVLFILLLAYYGAVESLAGILLSFALVDGVIAAVFAYYLWRHRRGESREGASR